MSDHDPSATQLSDAAAERFVPDASSPLHEVADPGPEEVNEELQSAKDELADTLSDLSNLMACSTVATLLLDRTLAVKRYTRGAGELFNLVPADLGRPLALLEHSLEYPELSDDAGEVLRTLVPLERLVNDEARNFLVRLQPCRTPEDRISGVVLTLLDVTEQKEAGEVLSLDLEATTLLSEVSLRLVPDGDLQELLDAILDAAIVIMRADAGTVQLYDAGRETLRLFSTRGIPKHVANHFMEVSAESRSPCGRALEGGRRVTTLFDSSLPDPTGDNRWHREEAGLLSAQSTPLVARNGRVLGMLSTHWKVSHFPNDRELRFFDLLTRLTADVLERRQSEELVRDQRDELQRCQEKAVEREARMGGLKAEVNELLARLGEEPRYRPETAGPSGT